MRTRITPRSVSLTVLALVFLCASASAATLDDIYSALVKKQTFLYSIQNDFFALDEKGTHGSSAFGVFDANPQFFSLDNAARFSPFSSVEIGGGYSDIFPDTYERFTYNPSDRLVSDQKFHIDYFREYDIALRIRGEPIEVFFDISGNRQKTKWNYTAPPGPVSLWTYNRGHYEDLRGGIRFLTNDQELGQDQSNLSRLRRPLLNGNQLNADAEFIYRHGIMKRDTYYYFLSQWYYYLYEQELPGHLESAFTVRYGICDTVELEGGLSYTTPYKYRYDYELWNPDHSSRYIKGCYKIKDNFGVPLAIRYRPWRDVEVTASSDFHVIHQRLDYWRKETDNIQVECASRRLQYYNVRPGAAITYLHSADTEIQRDEFSNVTKRLLRRGQWLVECEYEADITHLNKSPDNGAQNIIDPYNVFMYPTEYFVASSEYAAFLTGNTAGFAANVNAQNYQLAGLRFTYGISDDLNIGVKGTYRSESSFDHFVLNELRDRRYVIRPFYSVGAQCDWRVTKHSLLSFTSRIVPCYITTIDRQYDTKGYKSSTSYYEYSLLMKMLF